MISLAIKNIKTSFAAYRNIYALLLFTQFMAILILLLAYGITTSANVRAQEKKASYKQIYAWFEEAVPATDIKEILPEIFDALQSEMECCFVDMSSSGLDVELTSIMAYDNGTYYLPEESFEPERVAAGRYTTKAEMTEGSPVALAYGRNDKTLPQYGIGDKINIGNKEYEIVGVLDDTTGIYRVSIPMDSCTADVKVGIVSFVFKQFPTVNDYNYITFVLSQKFGSNITFNDLELVDLEDITTYNSIILLAFVVGTIAAFDTILVYSYLLKKRKRQMAVFSIEGATRTQRIMICVIEVLIITMLTTMLGIGVFELLIKKTLIEVYEISIPIYTLKVYLYLILSYIGTIITGTAVMITISTRKKALETRRA